jgi:hypothetical protein
MNILFTAIPILLLGADFPVCTEVDAQYYPTAIYAFDQYYAFWSDWRFGLMNYTYSLFGTRIARDGTVLDPGGKQLYRDTLKTKPKIASDGTNLLVILREGC